MVYKSVKVSEKTADRLREMKTGSFDTTLNCLMDSSCTSVSPETVKALEKKFGSGTGGNIDEFLKSYLVDDKKERIEAIKNNSLGTSMLKQFGEDDTVLDVIEREFVFFVDILMDDDGKRVAGRPADAIEFMLYASTMKELQKLKRIDND